MFARAAAVAAAVAIASPAPAATSRARILRMLSEMEVLSRFTGHELVSTAIIGRSVRGQHIPLVVIHDPTVPVEDTPRIMIICRQHGNEPASTEAMVAIIRSYFAGSSSSDLDLLKKVTLVIVPMMNPDGAARSMRRNANKVDLNRDWIAQSQPETRAVIRAIQTWQPALIIDAHELDPDDARGDFIECLGKRSLVNPELVSRTQELSGTITSKLRTRGFIVKAKSAAEPAAPRLAHRYLPRRCGVVTLLVETRQSGRRAWALSERASIHLVAAMTAARCLAGDTDRVRREVAQWMEGRAAVRLAHRGKLDRSTTNLHSRRATAGRKPRNSR